MPREPKDISKYNRKMWDAQVAAGNRWTQPVGPETIARAREGDFAILLTPFKPVPMDWFPDLHDCEILCLASGGGQQGPILAAAGGKVTVFDNSPRQLDQDRLVADRDSLDLQTVLGDMRDLSAFEDASFDFVFHPCSNCFVPNIRPVWREAFRVLRPGGHLVSGFSNPLIYLFDEAERERGELVVRHSIPYSDLTSLNEEEFARYEEREEPACFGHTLEDQIGGQIDAGFSLTGFYEDDWGPDSNDPLTKYIKGFIGTRATVPLKVR